SQAKTWAEFQNLCLKFQAYWKAKGFPHRHAFELNESGPEHVQLMLLQEGINLIDDRNRIHINETKVAKTLAFYAQTVAGPKNIGAQSSGGQAGFTKDLVEGNICAYLTPD